MEAARSELSRALGTRRLFSARLSGAAYGAAPVVRGAAAEARPTDLQIAAARLDKAARASLSPVALGGLGVSRMVMGDLGGAVRALEASWRFEETARTAVDLAAGYLARFEVDGRYADLPHALEAAERATELDPRLPDAAFNRALALEMSGLQQQARTAWQVYLALDAASGWADEVRNRLGRLSEKQDGWDAWSEAQRLKPDRQIDGGLLAGAARRFPQAAREWLEREVGPSWSDAQRAGDAARAAAAERNGRTIATALFEVTGDRLALDAADALGRAATKSTLAEGYTAYAAAVVYYRKHERAVAAGYFGTAESALREARSPLSLWAAVQRAVIDYHFRDLESAQGRLAAIDREASLHPYPVIRARVAWMRGLIEMQRGHLAEALPFYEDAARVYEEAGELENAGHVLNTWADTLRILGEYRAGWQVLGEALRRTPAFRDPIRRYVVFFNASLYARREALLRASLLFENEAVANAEQDTASPAAAVEAHLRRAALLGELGHRDRADADLSFAASSLPGVRDPAQSRYFTATRDAIAAEVFPDRPGAIASADSALDVLNKVEPADVPRVLLAKARAQRHARQWTGAERTLLDAIDAFESRRRLLKSSDDRIAYLDHGVDLYRELAGLRLARGDGSAAVFLAMERGRARTLFEDLAGANASVLPVQDLQLAIEKGSIAIVYSMLPDRLLTWVIGEGLSRFEETAIAQNEVLRRVDRLQTLMELGASRTDLASAAASLHELLIRPWIASVPGNRTLVFVPDGVLHQVPFAMLGSSGDRPLTADYAVALAPSASLLARRSGTKGQGEGRRPLIVGDIPGSGQGGADALPELPQSRAEAREIAALNPGSEILTRGNATPTAVRMRMPQASFVHFAGHALVDAYAPQLSRLVLTPEPGARGRAALYASEIARLDLRGVRVVLLAACETAGGPLRNGEGVASIARSFLAAGVPTVVATLWKIDDRAARTAFVSMHRAMRDGATPEEALRRAQREMHQSTDPVLSDPRQWAGLVVIKVGGSNRFVKES